MRETAEETLERFFVLIVFAVIIFGTTFYFFGQTGVIVHAGIGFVFASICSLTGYNMCSKDEGFLTDFVLLPLLLIFEFCYEIRRSN